MIISTITPFKTQSYTQVSRISCANLSPLTFDTISFGAKKKPKFFGKYDQNKVIRRFSKKGTPQQTIRSILDNPKKRLALAKFIEDYEDGNIKFSREPREREVALVIDNEFSYEQMQKLIDWQDNVKDSNVIFSRPLKTKEALAAIKENATEAQIQRALTLSDKDKDGKTYLSRSLTFKEGLSYAQKNYTDEQAQIYLNLVDNNIFARNVVDNPEKYQKLLKLTKNSDFSRNLSVVEAAGVIERDFTVEQAKRFIDLADNGIRLNEESKDEVVKLTQKQLYVIIGNNLSEFQAYYYLKYENKHAFFSIAKDENKLKTFLNLTGKLGEIPTTRPLKFQEATYILQTREELTNEQIQKYIDLLDKKVKSHLAYSIVIDFWKYLDKKDVSELTTKEKRDLLKKIMSQRASYLQTLSSTVDIPLIPTSKESYSIIVPKIASSIGMQTKELSKDELKTFWNGLDNLIQKISTIDLDRNFDEIRIDLEGVLIGLGEFEKTLQKEKDGNQTLKILQKVVKSEEFKNLNKKDKEILTIALLLRNISQSEDENLSFDDCSFDAFYIIQKLNLDETSQIKIYEIIKNQNWFEKFSEKSIEKYAKTNWRYSFDTPEGLNNKRKLIAQNVAFEARHGNTFELVKILSRAMLQDEDLNEFEKYCEQIEKCLKHILKNQIFLPQAKIPKASEIRNGEVQEDDEFKNVVLDLDKCDFDLEEYGFDAGTTKDNLYMLVHGLEEIDELSNFNAFSIIDSEALLSSSYMKPDNHKLFRKQGVILDVNKDDIHAGYCRDFGSGTKKTLEDIKRGCVFPFLNSRYGEQRSQYRTYIPNLMKEKLGLDNEEYIKLIDKIKSLKSWSAIQEYDFEVANALKSVFDEMELGKRRFNREYNEILISRPKVQAVFSYGQEYENIPDFLKKYAMDNDLAIILLGE